MHGEATDERIDDFFLEKSDDGDYPFETPLRYNPVDADMVYQPLPRR